MVFNDSGEDVLASQRALVANHAQGAIQRIDSICARLRTAGLDNKTIAAVRAHCFAAINCADQAGKAQAKLIELQKTSAAPAKPGILDWIKRKWGGKSHDQTVGEDRGEDSGLVDTSEPEVDHPGRHAGAKPGRQDSADPSIDY